MLITRSFAYNESRHDSHPQCPRSPLGTPETMTDDLRKTRKKKTLSFLESPSAKASSTKKENVGMNYVTLDEIENETRWLHSSD